MKKKNTFRTALLLSIALSLGLNPLFCTVQPANDPVPIAVRVIELPPAPESELSKALAGLINFFKDGIRETWNAYFAIQKKEGELAKGSLVDKLNAFQLAAFRGVLLATPALMSVIMLRGAKVGMAIIKRELVSPHPAILNKKQNPFHGRMARIMRWWYGYTVQKMVFNDEVIDRLIEIEKKTVLLRDLMKRGKNRHYANLLLYGKSGTGKTSFAQQLAYRTNMDFLPVTAASLLQKGVEGIKYFDELVDMANRSPYGAIIFIDEADGLLTNRDILDPDSDHYKVLEHILSVIDGRSNKFMVVAATNHENILDAAMNRRFQDQIMMPLPDKVTREKLLVLYVQHILFNEKETNKQFVNAAKALFTHEMIEITAEKLDGLSHAEIADMVEAMRSKAEINNRVIALVDIESAVGQAIMKHK